MKKFMKDLSLPISIIIASLIIAGAIIYTQKPKSVKPKSVEIPEKEKVVQEALPEEELNKPEEELIKPEFTISEKDHIKGNPEAPVTIVVYSDLQCPYCASFHQTLKQISADFPEQVRLVYKHFPLDQLHPQAGPAAEASECLAEQKGNEGFWQFIDLLFENQKRLEESLYQELAQKLGANMEQFNDCLSSQKYKEKVKENYQEGVKVGVRGTPASFINNQPFFGALPYQTLKKTIEGALSNL